MEEWRTNFFQFLHQNESIKRNIFPWGQNFTETLVATGLIAFIAMISEENQRKSEEKKEISSR